VKLADLLDLNAPLPKDPFEALLVTRARAQKLVHRTVEMMREIYPDYEKCVAQLHATEDKLTTRLGSFSTIGGEA
jgi:hypothetical protein